MSKLSEKVVAAHLSVSVWPGKKIDRRLSQEVADNHEIERSAGSYKKRLIKSRHLGQLRSLARAARTYHKSQTLPWQGEEGVGLLPLTQLVPYTTGLRGLKEKFDAAVTKFVQRYPDIIEESRDWLKTTFDYSDYPSQEALRGKFGFRTGMMNLPDTETLPAEFQGDGAADVRHQLDDYVTNGVAAAMRSLWDEFQEDLEGLKGQLADPTSTIRSNTITRLKKRCQLVKDLNVTDDPQLNAVRLEAEATIKELDVTDQGRVKAAAAQKVDEILSKFAKYGGK